MRTDFDEVEEDPVVGEEAVVGEERDTDGLEGCRVVLDRRECVEVVGEPPSTTRTERQQQAPSTRIQSQKRAIRLLGVTVAYNKLKE